MWYYTDSPESVPNQTCIAVWSLLSASVQVRVWQLLQPQRVHLPFTSLPPFLPPVRSTPRLLRTLRPQKWKHSKENVRVHGWSKEKDKSRISLRHPRGTHSWGRTEVWFHSPHTYQLLICHSALLQQVEGEGLRGRVAHKRKRRFASSLFLPLVTGSFFPPFENK